MSTTSDFFIAFKYLKSVVNLTQKKWVIEFVKVLEIVAYTCWLAVMITFIYVVEKILF